MKLSPVTSVGLRHTKKALKTVDLEDLRQRAYRLARVLRSSIEKNKCGAGSQCLER